MALKEFNKYKKFGPYHWKQYDQKTKYTRHADRVKEWITEQYVLDVGAGDGKITHLCGFKGIDNEPEAVRLAKEKGANVIMGDAYKIPYAKNYFDAVFMGDVLEHMEFPEKALAEASRVAPVIYLAVPTPEGKDPYHWQEWNEEELAQFMKDRGYTLDGDIIHVKEDKRIYGKFLKK